MDMYRVTARWSGFSGGPGYSNFYFGSGFLDGGLVGDEAELLAGRVRDSFDELSDLLPTGTRINIEPEVPIIDSDTGVIQSFNSIEAPPQVAAGARDNYAGPAGAVVTWRTADLRNGRRIRGRTFIVPLATQSFQSDGTLVSDSITALRAFADGIMGSSLDGDFGVWSRPSGGSGGVFASVTGYTVPDMVAVLRSRRD